MSGAEREQLERSLSGSYAIERELGGRGMSHVFVATETALGRQVVIKVLPPDIGVSLSAERFKQETRLTANLQHPNIVPVLTAGSAGDLLFYTMPFVQGESLRERLAREGRLPIAQIESIVRDVLRALSYAHAQGVVHRDIKPENILLTPHGALLTDFGIAKATAGAGARPGPAAGTGARGVALTGTGVSLGTVDYMAPEQLAADPDADHRMDLFAVGLVCHECLTGSLPFADLSPQRRLAAMMNQTPTAVRAARKDVPLRLAAFVERCLTRDRDARPATAEAALALLESGEAQRRTWRRLGVAAAVGVAVLVVGGWAARGPLRVPLATAKRIVMRPQATLDANRILVAPFEAAPDDDATRALGAMIADWVSQGLAVLNVPVVDSRTVMINAEVVDRIPRILRTGTRAIALAQETGARVLITGTVYRIGDSLRVSAVVVDAATRQIRQSLGDTMVDAGRERALLEWAYGRTVAAVRQASDTVLRADFGTLSTPPSLEAYETARLGLRQLLAWDTAAIGTLKRAAGMDSAYVFPRLLLVLAAANDLRYAAADSAIAAVRPLLARATASERALFQVHDANFRVDRAAALASAEELLRLSPGSVETQLLVVSEALYAGHLRRALGLLNGIDPDRGINLGSPFYWRYRAVTQLRLDDARHALDAARSGQNAFDTPNFINLEVQALAAQRRDDDAWAAFRRYATNEVEPSRRREVLAGMAAMWLLRAGDSAAAQRFAARATAELPPSAGRTHLAVFAGDSTAARDALRQLLADSAVAGPSGRFDYGEDQYRRAQIAMLRGDRERAVRLLAEAKAKGQPFNDVEGFRPHLDPLFAPLRGYPAFQKLVESVER